MCPTPDVESPNIHDTTEPEGTPAANVVVTGAGQGWIGEMEK